MKLRTKYLLLIGILHLLTLGLTFFIFRENRIYFIGAEILVIISAILSVQLYRQLIHPIKMLLQGIEAIKDKDFNVKFLPTGKYEVDELIGVYNRMIDELKDERTRQEEQHFFLEKLISTSPTGILVLDYDNRVHQLNPSAARILGMSGKTLSGVEIETFAHPILQQAVNLKAGESVTVKLNGVNTYKLQKSHFIDRGFQRNFLMIEELTAEILSAEKNAYGKVIRMMAHEVNNTIGPVNSILESTLSSEALWQHQPGHPLYHALRVAFDRNQNLNHFMRNFADLVKLPAANRKPVDLHALLGSVVALMQIRAAERRVKLHYGTGGAPLIIQADVQQLEQALINLVKNGIEAIEGSGVVSLTADAEKQELVIADNGKGITDAEANLLFTPFYSTKKDGQGIGLTLVREIMLNHGYAFSLKTGGDGITRFTIKLTASV
ncbi:sensor histidine kinase [Hufsiella ginkgonis]|uniref:histidine kinase n=1 Tax=Hufsiella ginkgonis TaxID=2695274 RepID=A0A7K1XVQ7_9SPHI|nr:ATP-binding protein [Hufsiella ginkgonis]MXV15064.1 HAMP domain-containing protein [Hufsiella ginkgonis]